MNVDAAPIHSKNPVTVLLTSNPFILLLRIALGGLFIFSSCDKLVDPNAFAVAIRGYELAPLALSNLLAIFVAWSEFVAGILLILGVCTRKAAAALFLLLLMFTVAITSTIVRGLAVDCGCFSNDGGSTTGWSLIVRNLFLMAGTLIVMLYDRGWASLGSKWKRS